MVANSMNIIGDELNIKKYSTEDVRIYHLYNKTLT